MSIKKNIFIIVVLLILFNKAYSQFNRMGYPFHKNFERSDYRAGLQSWMISQSPEGLMYFANNEGLMQFDGLDWNLYPMPNRTIVRSVFAAADGRIFVGCSNDLGYFEKNKTGELIFVSLLDQIPEDKRDFGDIWKIFKTDKGIIFQSYEQIMIYKGEIITIVPAPKLFHFSFYINNDFIITDRNKGVLKMENERLTALQGTDLLKNKEVCSVIPFGKNLLFATTDHGVYYYDGNNISEWRNKTSDFLKQNQIYTALRINKDYIAFGTIQNGLIICTNEGEPVFTINESTGLQNNTVLCLAKDSENNLWVGTDNGIDLLYINIPFGQLSKWQNLSAGYTAAVYNNILYLGTNRGLFYKSWNKCLKYPSRLSGFKMIENVKGQVWKLQVIDNKLFCGHNNGTYIINGEKAKKISDIPGAWKFLRPKKAPNKIICGTYTGLILFEKKNRQWVFSKVIDGFKESSRVMEFDSEENIWMSHAYKGVYHIYLNKDLDKITSVKFYDSKDGFTKNFDINVSILDNKIIFLTPDGIYRYNKETDKMVADDLLNRQFKNKIPYYLIETKNKKDRWFFTKNNILVMRKQEDGTYTQIELPFKPLEGKFIGRFQFVLPVNNNNVLFGYENGFIHYDPNYQTDYEKKLNVFINKVILSRTDSILYTGHLMTSPKNTPVIPYKENSLHFFFSAINYEYPEKNMFSTFLKGYDNDWSDWEKRLDREITNLKEGNYEFYVKVKNIYDFESVPLVYKFQIAPPWFRTDAAYIIYTIIIILIVILLTFLIQRRLNFVKKREKERQKQKFLEREKELQKEALITEKEIIKLRNEKLKSEMINKSKELADTTMQKIHKNKFLINIKSDLNKIYNISDHSVVNINVKRIIKKIDSDINNEDNWKVFEKNFSDVHKEFLNRLKTEFSEISPAELRLCACLRMNISSKEIADLLNISVRGVEASRYRLRKTLNLDRKTNLTDFILSY